MGRRRTEWTVEQLDVLGQVGPQCKWVARRIEQTGKLPGKTRAVIRRRMVELGLDLPTESEARRWTLPLGTLIKGICGDGGGNRVVRV